MSWADLYVTVRERLEPASGAGHKEEVENHQQFI